MRQQQVGGNSRCYDHDLYEADQENADHLAEHLRQWSSARNQNLHNAGALLRSDFGRDHIARHHDRHEEENQ
ncbi:hypothetical protein D3C71_1834570 [compost metagenome]